MSLYVVCECGGEFKVEPHLAGQVVNCPQCGQAVKLPPPAPTPTTAGDLPLPPPPLQVSKPGASPVVVRRQRQRRRAAEGPDPALKTIGVLLMVYGALTAGVSLYAAMQISGSSELIPIPDELGGRFFRGAVQHGEKAQYFATFMCLIFGGVQFAGGLGAFHCRFWGLSVAASILVMIPCIGSAYPCCVILGLPLGIWSIITVMKEKESFT